MMNAKTALDLILKGMEPALQEAEFTPVKPQPEGNAALFAREGETLRIKVEDDRAALQHCPRDPDMAPEGDFKQLAVSLLELDGAAEGDCRYIAGDFADVVQSKFRKRKKGAAAAPGAKLPKSISKTAIKNGEAYYDALSFGNSFTAMFPDLRAAYKANYEQYGEFLAEEFFLRGGGNDLVMRVVRENNQTQMKRLFGLLNEVYENGVNDVQSLICVTILGALEGDEVLLARCADHMSADLAPVAIRVNRYLASGAGKRAKQKLENPPLYKPKKEKKQGLLSQMMGGGGQGGMPGM
ncbi:MAG: hypothetical protein FWC27_10125 [Firmicutes bacterium]|nr:hypothetical protein [Bacillota bacterium]